MPTYSDTTLGAGYSGEHWIEPVWKMNDSDGGRTAADNWNGDRCIGTLGSVHILDQEWILSVSWGDGFAIRRINDDGTITRVSSDSSPNGYNHNSALAYHPGTRQAFISQYNTSRMGVVELGDWIDAGKPDDGAGINYIKNIYYKDATWNFPTDRVGTSYECGLKLAGDWLYMSSYSRDTLTGEVYRWNVITHEYETVQLEGNTYSTKNWEGSFVYDDQLDRMFYQVRWGGGLNIIENASSDVPRGYFVSYSGHGSNECRYKGVVYTEPGNTNKILVGGSYRFFELDITNIINGSTNTPTYLREIACSGLPWNLDQYYPFGSEDPYMLDKYRGGNPYGPKFIPIYADRGWGRKQGWFDLENFNPVGRQGENDYSHHRDTVFADYHGGTFTVTSRNGTDYHIHCGYGWDGHSIRVYKEPHLLKTSYSVTFGNQDEFNDFEANISAVDISTSGYTWVIPSDTSVLMEVSNNDGSTYEPYSGGIHEFTSVGTKLRVRFTANGLEWKMPYAYSNSLPIATMYGEGYENISELKTLTNRIAGQNG